jgi:hypothetical protein
MRVVECRITDRTEWLGERLAWLGTEGSAGI